MESSSAQQEVSIIDKDETSDKAVNIVGGFLIEESTSAFPVRTRQTATNVAIFCLSLF